MPVLKCDNGKWRIGSGKCIYSTRKKAANAFRGFLGARHAREKKRK